MISRAAIEACGALDYTFDRARAEVDLALEKLEFLPEGAHKTALQQLARRWQSPFPW